MTAEPIDWSGPRIDVDVHAVVPSLGALYPYLPGVWIQHIEERQWRGPSSALAYPPGLDTSVRPAWRPGDKKAPASEVSMVQEHVLESRGTEFAILNCLYAIDGGPPDLSVALARAANDWLVAEWLEADSRLRASIVLPSPADPHAMAAEIDRVGAHPGFVQALLPVRSGLLYGKRLFHPLFEAIERHDLVAGIHWGGGNDGLPPGPSGWPSWFVEEYVGEVGVFEVQLLSLIAEGTFQMFPRLRVSMLEIGFAWVPYWMWSLDRNWRGLRREVPWVNETPFSLVRGHVRFSTTPLDAGPVEELARIVKWLGPRNLLMYGSDYPHGHDGDLSTLLGAMPKPMRGETMAETAREWYRLEGASR